MDIDNRAKAVMDVLQHCKVITDDCLANRITMMWSEGEGCQVTIWKAEGKHELFIIEAIGGFCYREKYLDGGGVIWNTILFG